MRSLRVFGFSDFERPGAFSARLMAWIDARQQENDVSLQGTEDSNLPWHESGPLHAPGDIADLAQLFVNT